ncbi:MAG: AAA family ATPase [Bacillota bacterium]
MELFSYDRVLHKIKTAFSIIESGQRYCIAIDGCGGSGKSTFAEKIATLDERVKVIHVDDLYLPSNQRANCKNSVVHIGGSYDLERLLTQIITPYRQGLPARYQKYNWVEDELVEWDEIMPGQLLVIEGVYSLHRQLRGSYECTIWVDCPREERLRRGIERDGEALRDFWENEWMPLEDEYLITMQPRHCADYVIDGTNEYR